MATVTNGKHLRLDNFETIVDMMMSIVYREKGVEFFEAYEKEVREREGAGIRWELERMFKTLGGDATDGGAAGATTSAISAPIATVLPVAPRKRPLTATARAKAGGTPAKRKLFTAAAPLKAGKIAKKSPAKTVAKNAARKLAATAAPSTSGKKLAVTRRALRENVSDRQFLRQLNWSRWQEAFRDTLPTRGQQAWRSRRGDHEGYRACAIFPDTSQAGMYELSVQTADANNKVAVWCGFTSGFEGQNWDSHFLRNKNIQQNIDNILQRGGKLFARRVTQIRWPVTCTNTGVVCSSLDELRKLVRDTHDYAWSGKTTPRQLFPRRSRRSAVITRRGQPY